MRTARIEEARQSQSGKTLGVKLNGRWFQTKHWELAQMVGETIEITDESNSEWNGKTIYWLNEYVAAGTDSEDAPPGITREQEHRGSMAAAMAPTQSASAARETNKGRPDQSDNYTKNVLLLRFLGQCFSGYPFQTTDEAMVRSRARMLYRLGEDILSGKITETETGPRRGERLGPQRIAGVHDTPLVPPGGMATDEEMERRGKQQDDDFDTDEIPF